MLKPRSLAAALSGAVPDLATDPDRFQCYVERGRLLARGTPAELRLRSASSTLEDAYLAAVSSQ
jgi:hypothetical protein